MQQPVDEAQRQQQRGDPGGEREQRGEQPAGDHPAAWSRTVTVNGGALGGATSKVSPQRPTITSAGASREYVPGAVSGSLTACLPISMSSMANVAVRSAPVTGLPALLSDTSKRLLAAAWFGSTFSVSV